MPDHFIQRFLDDPASREAREWLHSGDCTLGELQSHEEAIAFVEQAYALGAVKVLAVEIDVESQNTGKLVIELPAAPDARRALFAWEAETAESLGFDGAVDTNQSHLFVSLD